MIWAKPHQYPPSLFRWNHCPHVATLYLARQRHRRRRPSIIPILRHLVHAQLCLALSGYSGYARSAAKKIMSVASAALDVSLPDDPRGDRRADLRHSRASFFVIDQKLF